MKWTSECCSLDSLFRSFRLAWVCVVLCFIHTWVWLLKAQDMPPVGVRLKKRRSAKAARHRDSSIRYHQHLAMLDEANAWLFSLRQQFCFHFMFVWLSVYTLLLPCTQRKRCNVQCPGFLILGSGPVVSLFFQQFLSFWNRVKNHNKDQCGQPVHVSRNILDDAIVQPDIRDRAGADVKVWSYHGSNLNQKSVHCISVWPIYVVLCLSLCRWDKKCFEINHFIMLVQ